ncbi:2-hydroxy-palmitic acid dioxygenase mpo1-like isoform X1 [Andrographis paniculata]|uniref:2-hydroxy-palmitic acid dioxygenase mpo1-like isoform X1 n=1 Tax=Andrographis paniculata TaxID=175694 RepID=UPI0021E9A3D1|nr:2-hydroxy-palmitic acid dioxygenase mpo1-like isoform X1 [Andrographis paniculata]
MGLFDLESNYASFAAYHRNPINIFIHMILTWPTVFTASVLLYFTPPLIAHSPIQLVNGGAYVVLNYGFFMTLIYALYYVILDRRAGSLAALLCFLGWIGSSVLGRSLGFSLAWKVVLASQILCWSGLFIGHAVFEKRAPAIFDNFAQATLMGSFFVLLEILRSCFGYEPYPGFHAKVKVKIDAEVKAWNDAKLKKAY